MASSILTRWLGQVVELVEIMMMMMLQTAMSGNLHCEVTEWSRFLKVKKKFLLKSLDRQVKCMQLFGQ